MQIEIRVATDEDLAEWYNFKGSVKLDQIEMLAPVQRPGRPSCGKSDAETLLMFSAEGIGTHGAYEATTEGRDFHAPIIQGDFSFLLSYPLDRNALISVSAGPEHGYSIADLISAIQAAYEGIYRMEDGDTPAPDSFRAGDVTFLNRPATEGMFGIWGHGMSSLAIEAIEVFRLDNGKYTIQPFIGS